MDSHRSAAFKRRVRYPLVDYVPGHFHRWVENLFAEPRLYRTTWESIVDAVLATPEDARVEDVFTACVDVFRQCRNGTQLIAPEAKIPSHRTLGRAVTLTQLDRELRDRAQRTVPSAAGEDIRRRSSGLGGSRLNSRNFINALVLCDVEDLSEQVRELRLHDHLMWSTFDPDNKDPFARLPENRRMLRCILGLLGQNAEIVRLIYFLPSEIVPHIPTVAEAYAGGRWDVLFKPAHDGATCGHTMPLAACGNRRTQPEVVHLPVTLKDLSGRPTIL